MDEIKLSTGKLCPRCGCNSLESYHSTRKYMAYYFDIHFHCVLKCGMDFGLSKLKNGKIKIGYDEENKLYLMKRFKSLGGE